MYDARVRKEFVAVLNARATIKRSNSCVHTSSIYEACQKHIMNIRSSQNEIYLEGPKNSLKYFEGINCVPLWMLSLSNEIAVLEH
jgi:hypothetical protein